jgi:hypothetical protein
MNSPGTASQRIVNELAAMSEADLDRMIAEALAKAEAKAEAADA